MIDLNLYHFYFWQALNVAVRKKQYDFDLVKVKASSVTFKRGLDPDEPPNRSLRNVMRYRVGPHFARAPLGWLIALLPHSSH